MNKVKVKVEQQSKREPITMRLSQDAIVLGRSMARSLHGSEDKIGNLVEEALNFYSAHREDEARASAILKVTEENLFKRFNEQVENMYKAFTQRDSKLTERLAGLMAVSSFETALIESMLKDLYCRDEKTKARYEELRSVSSKKMKDRYEKANVTEVLELQEKVRLLEKEVGEWKESSGAWEDETKTLKSEKADLKERYDETVNKLSESKKRYSDVLDVLKEYLKLVQWYEKRDNEIPEIQEKNKKLLSKQPYEEALKEFENKYSKPQVRAISFK